ncbi:sensor histidine kinase [Nostoc sp. 'Peltigera malacea cyanobiont' DB3992]|uniref:sensor histidine kinase n=1 Tax=Nostoc sp. 'Peltigera malacea cyanobiont' DB3992 TaxID=1206980 RepID=UPI000C042DCF|nr:ATP-binding protein [Nostoc sp. 'Peltigera malacea cyanobiont' DB3992]PHM08599.1 histidine kinase [Nostoc sp. 'Peltigera malacea cyanobiont' DB3992]
MKIHPSSKVRAFSLQLVLIVPFVLQVFAIVGLVGYLSFKNGEKAVNNLADQLMERTSGEVNQHLDAYLSIPHKVIQLNADAIRMGLLDVRDRLKVGKYFWHEMQAYDLTFISLNLATGEGTGAGRYDGKTVTIDDNAIKTPSLPKNTKTYLTDNDGNPTKVMTTSTWDTVNELAYTEPVKAGKPIWVRIYTYYDPAYPPYIVASAGRPIYDASKKLIGVVGAEIHLLKLSEFLQKLNVSRLGQVFIMERDGMLVANSAQEKPFSVVNNEIKRLKAIDSPNPAIQNIAKQLQQRIPNFQSITNTQKLKVNVQGENFYVHIVPWRDQYGLDWLVVVGIPEKTYMAQIHANTQISILLCFGALIVATTIGIFTSRWIAYPILRLNQTTQAIAFGDLQQTLEEGNIDELNTLGHSFNHMAGQLRESFIALENSNAELEARVEQRTVELKTALSELQRTQAQVVQSEKMSSLGQLVAGIAHEINNPVNFIHGNITHLDEYTQNLLQMIYLYQERYSSHDPEIQALAEEIDLEFLIEDLQKILPSMKMGTERIRNIVRSLRNFSRMDEAEFKTVDIHEGIESTLLILQHRLKDKPDRPAIEVIKDYGNLPQAECFPGQLNQVLMNILVNAMDALDEADIKRTSQQIEENPSQITIRTSVVDSQSIEIAIADNAQGMPESVQSRIFDPFFTTKPVGKGTGMGMAISYQIITEKHGGKLLCFSSLGEGSNFIIQVPIRQQAPERVLKV